MMKICKAANNWVSEAMVFLTGEGTGNLDGKLTKQELKEVIDISNDEGVKSTAQSFIDNFELLTNNGSYLQYKDITRLKSRCFRFPEQEYKKL